MDPDVVVAYAGGRLIGQLALGDEVASSGRRTDELDAHRLAHHAAAAVGADEVGGSQLAAVREVHVDAGVVLPQTDDVDTEAERHPELLDPATQDAFDLPLRQAHGVRVAGREGGHVEGGTGEAHRLEGRALGEEAVGDATLVEELDRPRVEPAGSGADEVRGRTAFEDGDANPRQRELTRQHQARRAGTDDGHVVRFDPGCLALAHLAVDHASHHRS